MTIYDDLVTKQELLKKFHLSNTTFWRRRLECEQTPYKDAIVKNGRKIYIHLDRWIEFMEFKSKHDFEEKYGL